MAVTWNVSGSPQYVSGGPASFTVPITTYNIGDQIILVGGAVGNGGSVYAGQIDSMDSPAVSGGITADVTNGLDNFSGIWRGIVTAVGTYNLNVYVSSTNSGAYAALVVQSFTVAGTMGVESSADLSSGGSSGSGSFPSLSPVAGNELYVTGGQIPSTPFTTTTSGFTLLPYAASGLNVGMGYILNATTPNTYSPNWSAPNYGAYNLLAELLTTRVTGNPIVMLL